MGILQEMVISSNPFNLEKAIQKFQQLAKDAQSQGDPVLVENYLQHADHFSRRLAEVNLEIINSTNQNQSTIDKSKDISKKEPEIQNKTKKNSFFILLLISDNFKSIFILEISNSFLESPFKIFPDGNLSFWEFTFFPLIKTS